MPSQPAVEFSKAAFSCMVPGSAPALGCRRVCLAPDLLKQAPACGRIFSTQPARARAGAPGGGCAPRDRGAAALVWSPKAQARMRRLGGSCELGIGFAYECETGTGAALPREWDDTEVVPPVVSCRVGFRLRRGSDGNPGSAIPPMRSLQRATPRARPQLVKRGRVGE